MPQPGRVERRRHSTAAEPAADQNLNSNSKTRRPQNLKMLVTVSCALTVDSTWVALNGDATEDLGFAVTAPLLGESEAKRVGQSKLNEA